MISRFLRDPGSRCALAAVLITACADGSGGSVAPEPRVPSMVLVAPDTLFVRLGEARSFSASVRASDGSLLQGVPLIWSASNASIVDVSGNGTVTARQYGVTTVVARWEGVSGQAFVQVAGAPGLRIVSGAGTADTIRATVPALVVEVRDARGMPVAGVTVEFVPLRLPAENPFGDNPFAETWLIPRPSRVTTDSNGRASAELEFGTTAGAAAIRVLAPTLGYADTARFTVKPGAPTSVAVAPVDTTIHIGGTYTPRAGTVDRMNNLRPDPVTITAASDIVSVAGGVVTGLRFGRDTLAVRWGNSQLRIPVNVVPAGAAAAYLPTATPTRPSGIYTFNLDGSDLQLVRRTLRPGPGADMVLDWLSPTQLIYHDTPPGSARQLFVHDLATGQSRRFLAAGQRMGVEGFPFASRDGSWVYFVGTGDSASVDSRYMSLYRARSDGTGVEQMTQPRSVGVPWGFSVSPDGSRAVYVVGEVGNHGALEIINLATRQVQPLNRRGISPRWSPDGSRIAYVASPFAGGPFVPGALILINSDGSAPRTLNTDQLYDVDWSPDGEYLIGSQRYGGSIYMVVLHAETGRDAWLRMTELLFTLQGVRWRR